MRWTTFSLFLAAAVVGARPAGAQSSSCENPPQVLIVLDRSSSMGERNPLPDGTLKWDAAVDAIDTLTHEYEYRVDFGLMMFPGDPGECTPGHIDVGIGPGTADAIVEALATPPPYSGYWTPMAESLRVAAGYAPLRDRSRRSFIALVTDGWQWCDPYDPATRFDPVTVAEDLEAMGVTVYIIGFGEGVDALTLNRAAHAAGTALVGCDPTGDSPSDPDNCYVQVDDHAGLSAALDEVAALMTEEVCDGEDNDCDGEVDEGLVRACDTRCGPGEERCEGGAWTDCDARAPSDEVCDGEDNDCDGILDEGCACLDGESRPCGSNVGACEEGTQACRDGRWGECDGAVEPYVESCNGVDDDCDGEVDETGEVECPRDEVCVDGECVDNRSDPADPVDPDPEDDPPDAGSGSDGSPSRDDGGAPEGPGIDDGGVSGCACSAGGARRLNDAAPPLLLALTALIMLRRRPR